MKPLILTITVSALALGAFVWFLPENLGAQRASTFTHDPTRDPKPGLSIAELSVPTTDVLGRAIPIEQRRDLFVVAGSCTGCSLNAVDFALLPTREFTRVFVVYQSDLRTITEGVGTRVIPENVYIIADPDERSKDVLNATWIGRWYVFDDGGLRDMQQDLDDKGWGG